MAASMQTDLAQLPNQTPVYWQWLADIYLPDLPDGPYHPDTKFEFPKRDIGVTMRVSLWLRY